MRFNEGNGRRALARALMLVFLFPLLVSCSSEPDQPEAQVRALLKRAAAAAESKESGVLRGLISEKYSDSQGRDKKAVEAILRYYLLRNESIYLFTRIQSIEFPEASRARSVVLVAMAGQPIVDAHQIERLHADLHRFDITLVREGRTWKVTDAEWRRAVFGDFL